MRLILTFFLLLVNIYAFGGEIIVHEGENIHDALRQAREWRRLNDARCEGGITITLQAGRYYMNEPLFIRPEDSGTKESPLVIRGIGEKPHEHHLWRCPTTAYTTLAPTRYGAYDRF